MKPSQYWIVFSVGMLFMSTNLLSQQSVNFNKIILVNNSNSPQLISLTDFESNKKPFYIRTLNPGRADTITVSSKYPQYGISNGARFIFFYKDYLYPITIQINDNFKIIIIGSTIDYRWNEFVIKYDSLRKIALNYRGQEDLGDSCKREFEEYFLNSIDRLVKLDTFIALKAFLRFESDIRRFSFSTPKTIDIIVRKLKSLAIKNHPLNDSNRIEEGLLEVANFRVGAKVENFFGFSTTRDTININQYFNKPLLILFWASWCSPCRNEGREIIEYYDSIKNNNIEIIGISLDEQVTSWEMALEQEKYPWEQIIILSEEKSRVQNKYLAYAIPKSILLSSQGKILKINPTITFLTSFSK